MIQLINCKANDEELISIIESLAHEIWHEHYTSIIGKDQIVYLLDKYQSKKSIQTQIKNGHLYYLIKDSENNYAGYICVAINETDMLLSKIYIKSASRGKGYAKYSIRFAENLAKGKNLSRIFLYVNKNNTSSIKAYKKMGFVIAESVMTDVGNGYFMDDFIMENRLSYN